MKTWRDNILEEFIPDICPLTFVADPDSLLTEEKLALELQSRGFRILEYNNSITFRYEYESIHYQKCEKNNRISLIAILSSPTLDLDTIPYDLLERGRCLSFNLGKIFPNLSYSIIEQLDRKYLDAVYTAYKEEIHERLGDHATQDFILLSVFGIDTSRIKTSIELLKTLLKIHYPEKKLPFVLNQRLIEILIKSGYFSDWPIEKIVLNKDIFFSFLQERWPFFVTSKYKCSSSQSVGEVYESKKPYSLVYPGPIEIPFDHPDIKIYINDLFIESRLHPVHFENSFEFLEPWIKFGLIDNYEEDLSSRLSILIERVGQSLPDPESRYSEWLLFASRYAELKCLYYTIGQQKIERLELQKLLSLKDKITIGFSSWICSHYASLISLPPTPPVMLHHIPRYLVQEMDGSPNQKIALLLIDGLSLDQWISIRAIVKTQNPSLIIDDRTTFAWIPTLTSVSRQAVFSGKAPVFFPNSINTTDKEAALWIQFWEENGLKRSEVGYLKGPQEDIINKIKILENQRDLRVIGLVIDKVDKILHGMQLGEAGMHNQIKQWCENGFLNDLITYLLDTGFVVWLTSDHGNIECVGKGNPSEGALAEIKGERVRIFNSENLRHKIAEDFIFSLEWDPVGLPANYYPLIIKDTSAFIQKGKKTVAHGGISIDELIVPFIKIEKQVKS
jgi:hypothetical protein